MADLVLITAGGLARETAAAVGTGGGRVRGFLDDDPALAGQSFEGIAVIGSIADIVQHPDADVVVCAGRGTTRRALVARLTALGVGADRYATVIHPSVDVPAGCTVGGGSVLLAQVALTTAVRLGRHVVAMPHVTFTHDDVVGDYATLCAGVSLGGSVQIGEAAYLGMNASVREGVRIGPRATVGMGAAAIADVTDDDTVVGVPATTIRREVCT